MGPSMEQLMWRSWRYDGWNGVLALVSMTIFVSGLWVVVWWMSCGRCL